MEMDMEITNPEIILIYSKIYAQSGQIVMEMGMEIIIKISFQMI
jgi:hypothetical protein